MSYFHYIHSVVAGVSIIIGASQLLGSVYAIIVFDKFLINDCGDPYVL